ncbi:hypothetical protein LEP1GSC170_2252 [Leptospira interrogans serovar Bataviae str. HAI135]|nr:hypothetical protein LEP1GSC170_2252 [Leptospira interrogans serovar Bataviae str. HAI135]
MNRVFQPKNGFGIGFLVHFFENLALFEDRISIFAKVYLFLLNELWELLLFHKFTKDFCYCRNCEFQIEE